MVVVVVLCFLAVHTFTVLSLRERVVLPSRDACSKVLPARCLWNVASVRHEKMPDLMANVESGMGCNMTVRARASNVLACQAMQRCMMEPWWQEAEGSLLLGVLGSPAGVVQMRICSMLSR